MKSKGQSVSEVLSLLEKADYGPDFKLGEINTKPIHTDGNDTFHGDSEKAKSVKEQSVVKHKVLQQSEISTSVNTSREQSNSYLNHSELDLKNSVDYFKTEGLFYQNNIYSLPQEELMNKVTAKRTQGVKKGFTEINNEDLEKKMSSLKINTKDRYKRSDTKFKQRVLQRDFDFDE